MKIMLLFHKPIKFSFFFFSVRYCKTGSINERDGEYLGVIEKVTSSILLVHYLILSKAHLPFYKAYPTSIPTNTWKTPPPPSQNTTTKPDPKYPPHSVPTLPENPFTYLHTSLNAICLAQHGEVKISSHKPQCLS